MRGLKHSYQFYKLYSLKKILEDTKPKNILEFGSGSSTLIFIEYLQNFDCTLTSVDEDKAYLDGTKKLSSKFFSDISSINFVHAPKKHELIKDGIKIYYDLPDYFYDNNFDFVFIDGPSLSIDGKKNKLAVNTNISDLLKYGDPSIIIIDIMKAIVEYLKTLLSDTYKITVSDVIRRKYRFNYTYFSIFKKNF